jgi:hypothetical protein
MGRLRRQITYANVVSTLALFLALGGSAVYAAGKIGGDQIKKGAIRSYQIQNSQVRRQDIAGGSINSRKVSNESLTGKDIKESTLGLVPLAQDAHTLNGATLRTVRFSQGDGAGSANVLSVGGLSASLACPGGTATLTVRGSTSGDAGTLFDSDSGGVLEFNSGTPQTITTAGASNTGIVSVHRVEGTLTRLDFDLFHITDGYGTADDCFLNGFLVSGK